MRRLLVLLAALSSVAAGPFDTARETAPSWVMKAAAGRGVDIDFARGRSWPAYALGAQGAPQAIKVTRASIAYEDDLAGNWWPFAAGQLRITNKGALIEEARTNGERNNTMVGAVVSGALPTNWSISTAITGLTTTVQAIGVVNGVNTIDIRVSGTASGGGNYSILTDTTTGIAALYGQTWAGSVFVAQIAGSMSNIGLIRTVISEYNSGGTSLATTNATIGTTAALTRFASTRTLVTATTAGVGLSVVPVISGAGAVDITLRIGWPQLENNGSVLSTVASTVVAGGGTVTGVTRSMWIYSSNGITTIAQGTATIVGTAVTAFAITNAGAYAIFPPSPAPLVDAVFTGSISGTTLTVSATVVGTVAIGQVISDQVGGVSANTVILSGSGTTWTVNNSQTIASRTLGGTNGTVAPTLTLTPTNNAASAFATSPIPTTNAAVARAADVATMVLPAGTTSTAGYSLLGIGTPAAPTGYSNNQFLAQIDDGTNTNRVIIFRLTGTGAPQTTSSGGGSISAAGTWGQGVSSKISTFVNSSANKISFNNGTVVSGAASSLPVVNGLHIGSSASSTVQWNGYISRIVVAPASLLNN